MDTHVGRQGCERYVGVHHQLVAAGDMDAGAERSHGYGASGTPEHVDWRDGFQFFKTLWQDDENRGHGGAMQWNDEHAAGLATKTTEHGKKNARTGRRLVIFGAGYVGGALASRAVAEGWSVTALTRNIDSAAALRERGCAVVVARINEVDWWDAPELTGDFQRVAVTVAAGGGGVEGYRRSYVEGLASVAGWAKREVTSGKAPGHLIYTSSTSVYPQAGGVRVTEQHPIGGEAETTQVLIEAERLVAEWPGAATILRLAGIYGPGRTHLVEQVRRGEVSGQPQVHLNLIHRDDIVDACAAVWARGGVGPEIFNLADDGAATKEEVVTWLAGRLGLPPPVYTGAPAVGRRGLTPDRIIDAARARALLGWRPRHSTFREGYAEVLADSSE